MRYFCRVVFILSGMLLQGCAVNRETAWGDIVVEKGRTIFYADKAGLPLASQRADTAAFVIESRDIDDPLTMRIEVPSSGAAITAKLSGAAMPELWRINPYKELQWRVSAESCGGQYDLYIVRKPELIEQGQNEFEESCTTEDVYYEPYLDCGSSEYSYGTEDYEKKRGKEGCVQDFRKKYYSGVRMVRESYNLWRWDYKIDIVDPVSGRVAIFRGDRQDSIAGARDVKRCRRYPEDDRYVPESSSWR